MRLDSCKVWWAAILASTAICGVMFAAAVCAEASQDSHGATVNWALTRVSHGESVDLNERCHTTALDPGALTDERWADGCRQLPASFLIDVLVRSPSRENRQATGLHIVGALISGDINLQFATLHQALIFENCRFAGGVDLSHLRTDSVVYLKGSDVLGTFVAEELHGDMSLVIDRSEFHRSVSLVGARITGDVSMDGATFDASLDADQLQAGGSLFMRSTDVNKARFQDVVLRAAKVAGNVELDGAVFSKDLKADGLTVAGYLLMQTRGTNKASFQGVRLLGARIGRDVQMNQTTFNGLLDGNSMEVGGSLMLREAVIAQSGNFGFAKIGLSMDARGATVAELKLSGVIITQSLILGGSDKASRPVVWRMPDGKPGSLSLRDTHVGALTDSKDAWPKAGLLYLEGFAFSRLGGAVGDAGHEMRNRDLQWWDDWIQRDPNYSPSPYEQLAKAFDVEGDRDRADGIRYLGRVQQRNREKGGSWIFDGLMQSLAGFGIGGYTFRVLYWVVGISLAGTLYLLACVPAARVHGPIWCFGASLSRLLPVIEVNKEFSDFFDDPERKRLTGRQSFVFAVVGLVGWVLGAILVAAVSGLTQKPQ